MQTITLRQLHDDTIDDRYKVVVMNTNGDCIDTFTVERFADDYLKKLDLVIKYCGAVLKFIHYNRAADCIEYTVMLYEGIDIQDILKDYC